MPSSPPDGESRSEGIYHQFLWPESCPVSSHTNQELCGEARLETVLSRVRSTGRFDPCADAVTPEGFGCYCADQNAVAIPGGPTPPKGPARSTSRARKGVKTAGSERTWQSLRTSSLGRSRKTGSPYCKSECNLRVKRSDP